MKRGARSSPDICGCAMGARFLAVALIGSMAWYGWHWRSSGLSVGGGLLRVMIVSFIAATAGKIVGIIQARLTVR